MFRLLKKGGIQLKVTVKEWCAMSDHNKQLLLNAVATTFECSSN